MSATSLQKLEAKIEAQRKALEQLKARKQAIQARDRIKLQGQERKNDTRRKVLAGAMTLEMMAESDDAKKRILARLDTFLKRNDDRALFDLPALSEPQDKKSEPAS